MRIDKHPMETTRLKPSRRRTSVALVWVAMLLAILAGAMALAWQVYASIGRTPGELLDYVDRRLEGHTKLERLAEPFLAGLRSYFDAAPVRDRAGLAFVVPAPPARRGPADINPIAPAPAGTQVWRVGPNGPLHRIADAAKLAKSGDIVEIEAADYRGDVAVWNQSRLTIRGINGAARLHSDGQVAEGKAIWVIRRGEFDISNIDFIGATASDGNGAGIRFEGGRLRVRHCLFWGNQMGLLTSNGNHAKDSHLAVEHSEFAYSHVNKRWGHNLYVGTIESLSVVGSYFHHAGVGHLLKSRAKRTDVSYSRLTDEAGGRASYELELPNGGEVILIGNIVQQQSSTENSIVISYGAEGYPWQRNTLLISSNTLVNDHPHGGTFLRVARGAQQVVTANNLLVGFGGFQVEDPLLSFNDQRADWRDFSQPQRYDYRLRATDALFKYRPSLADVSNDGLVPASQYVHPMKVEPLSTRAHVVGADQQPAP